MLQLTFHLKDHNSLIWLMRFKNVEGQLARWLEAISHFDFQISHRPVKSLWRMKDLLASQEDGRLTYLWKGLAGNLDRRLIVVPQSLRKEVMQLGHSHICSGHPGPEKTCQLLFRHFYWPEMQMDVCTHVLGCDACSRHKKPRQHPCSPMVKYQAGEPMDRVHLDILGPLADTAQGNRYVW